MSQQLPQTVMPNSCKLTAAENRDLKDSRDGEVISVSCRLEELEATEEEVTQAKRGKSSNGTVY